MGGLAAGELCKCSPSDSCWPSSSEWDSFNRTISGQLIHAVPPGSVCYPSKPNYDKESCDIVLSSWTSSVFHSSDPVSASSAWSNSTCVPIYPNGTRVNGDPDAGKRGCSLGALPPYVVNVTDASQVQQAVKFAKQRNLRVVIKNTGHNGAGRQFHEKFQASGCSTNATWKGSQMAITIGAGIQDGELFDFAKQNEVVAVGGTNMDVGVVGWATGGGHGYMTGEYGMGADNILEATIVVPNGDVVTANACKNEDIFWAIRGGGGGTFGVIVNMTMKAYAIPKMRLLGFDAASKNGTSAKAWWKFVAQFHGLLPGLQQQGVKGYYTIGGPPSSATIGLSSSILLWNKANGTTEKLLAPLQQPLSANNGAVTGSIAEVPIPSFYDLISTVPVHESGARSSTITAARLITENVVVNEQDLLAEVLEEVGTRINAPEDGMSNLSMSGKMTIGHEPRDSVVHLITQQTWDPAIPSVNVTEVVSDMTYNKLNALRRLDPNSGTYLNEANTFEPGWQWSFFGPNYGRLRFIKESYDPAGLLWCPQCVGSEDWIQGEDGKLCKAYQPFH
ncbi:FAD binding domain-containing protein [Colletotrichum incanum]|nr:FAD binding domain-containing protein [Colletotrichum incanum]